MCLEKFLKVGMKGILRCCGNLDEIKLKMIKKK